MKIVMGLSGGMDSAALCAYYLDSGDTVYPINFNYGSKHNRYEQEAALKLAKYFKTKPLVKIDLNFIGELFRSNLLLTGGKIPEGHYADATMQATVVPGRNLIFISIMLGYAQSIDAEIIAYGAHSGDHHIYADCRPDFFHVASLAVTKSSEKMVTLEAPFMKYNKIDILRVGNLTNPRVPWELTRTCYKDQPVSCGKCGSCIERLEAFKQMGMKDPITYEEYHGG